MNRLNKEQEVIKVLFKEFLTPYNSRSLSKIIGISHAGAFKILKRLEEREIVKSKIIGKAVIYSLNIENPVTLREIEMALTVEAQGYKRWIEEFEQLKDKIKFAVLFGSILKEEKKAKDVDLLIIAEKDKFKDIKKIIELKNKILYKKIHLILQLPDNFNKDIFDRNKTLLEILRTGVVLFGQEEITKIMSAYLK